MSGIRCQLSLPKVSLEPPRSASRCPSPPRILRHTRCALPFVSRIGSTSAPRPPPTLVVRKTSKKSSPCHKPRSWDPRKQAKRDADECHGLQFCAPDYEPSLRVSTLHTCHKTVRSCTMSRLQCCGISFSCQCFRDRGGGMLLPCSSPPTCRPTFVMASPMACTSPCSTSEGAPSHVCVWDPLPIPSHKDLDRTARLVSGFQITPSAWPMCPVLRVSNVRRQVRLKFLQLSSHSNQQDVVNVAEAPWPRPRR